MGRASQPAELAPVFVFLASQEADYANGEVALSLLASISHVGYQTPGTDEEHPRR